MLLSSFDKQLIEQNRSQIYTAESANNLALQFDTRGTTKSFNNQKESAKAQCRAVIQKHFMLMCFLRGTFLGREEQGRLEETLNIKNQNLCSFSL